MNENLEKIIRDAIRAVLQERGIEIVPSADATSGGASTRAPKNGSASRELSRFERASLSMEQGAAPPQNAFQNVLPQSGESPVYFSMFSGADSAPDAPPVSPPNVAVQNALPQNAPLQNVPSPIAVASDRTSQNALQNVATGARVLAAVCCGECLSDEAKRALQTLTENGFAVSQPSEDDLKRRAPREAMISAHDVVLLPAVGDDDAAKMAAGIFDEPVTRTALAALASGVPVYLILHLPYAQALKSGSPNLARVLENNRRALQTLGFNVVEANALNETLRARFATTQNAASTRSVQNGGARSDFGITFGANMRGGSDINGRGAAGLTSDAARGVENFAASTRAVPGGARVLITAQDIDLAARSGQALQLSPNAIITPLARDRARELNFPLDG